MLGTTWAHRGNIETWKRGNPMLRARALVVLHELRDLGEGHRGQVGAAHHQPGGAGAGAPSKQ